MQHHLQAITDIASGAAAVAATETFNGDIMHERPAGAHHAAPLMMLRVTIQQAVR